MAWHEIVDNRKPVIQGVVYVIRGNSGMAFGPPGGGLCVFSKLAVEHYSIAIIHMSQTRLVAALGIVVALLAIGGGAYYWWTGTPQHTLTQIKKAYTTHNVELAFKYIDFDAVFENMWSDVQKEMTSDVSSGDGWGAIGAMIGQAFAQNLKPSLKEQFRTALTEAIGSSEQDGQNEFVKLAESYSIRYEGDLAIIEGNASLAFHLKRENEHYWRIVAIKGWNDKGKDSLSGDGKSKEDVATLQQENATEPLTVREEKSASAFATQVERYTQQRDFAKLYELICPKDTAGVTKAEYVKAATNVWGANRITSFEIKSVLEEEDGATVQLVENTANGGSEAQLMELEKSGSGWCFRSSLTTIVSQVKGHKDIALTVTDFDRPYVEEYGSNTKEGFERVRVALSIKNNGDAPLVCHALNGGETQCNEFFFRLKDSAGAQYSTEYVSAAKMPLFTIAPHTTVTGSLGFEIPAGSSGYTLIFHDLGYQTDIASVSAGF